MGTWRGTDSEPKELFTYQQAGLAGHGGSSYIDLVLMRDRDDTNSWTGSGDGTRPPGEQRHWYAQKPGGWCADAARSSTTAGGAGDIQEWIKYSSYGIPFLLTPGDFNKDGTVDKDDDTLFTADYGSSNARADLNKDGSVTSADQTIFNASYAAAENGGRWKLSSSTIGNRKGYAGYEAEGFGNDLAVPQLAHVRNRVLHFGLGRWTRRDPMGYVDGASLASYTAGAPICDVDPDGLTALTCCAEALAWINQSQSNPSTKRGVTGCCNGTATICVFESRFKDTPAKQQAIHCVKVHECRHKIDLCNNRLAPCAADARYNYQIWEPSIANSPSEREQLACSEYCAYRDQVSCLTAQLLKCSESGLSRQDRIRCEQELGREIQNALDSMNENLRKCPSPSCDPPNPGLQLNPGDDVDANCPCT